MLCYEEYEFDLTQDTGSPRKSAQGGITGLGDANEQN